MSRINPVRKDTATPEQIALFETVEKAMGGVPNLISTMAHSPAVANAYLTLNQALSRGLLKPAVREQLALTVGQENGCNYCLAAHSVLGGKAGLSKDEILAARKGTHEDAKTAAALSFAQKAVRNRGNVSDADLAAARSAGLSDGEIGEIVAHVALNVFTNYFNHVADTEIDFPAAPAL